MQIDWTTGYIETPPELAPGYDIGECLKIGPGGELLRRWANKASVQDDEGSFSRNFMCWTPTTGKLFLSGNPVKLLQGHNAFGSCDAVGLYLEAGQFVRRVAGWFPGFSTWESCQFTGPHFTRLDLTRSYRFPSAAYAQEWLRQVAAVARDRRGASLFENGTVYFGKHSSRWTMKLYEKQGELLKAGTKRGQLVPKAVLEWASGVVRFELTLRPLELEKWPGLVSALRPGTGRAAALKLWEEYYARVNWNRNANMGDADMLEETLPSHLRVKLAAWRSGADLRSMMSRPSFYRVRRELMAAVHVDIASPPPTEDDAITPVHSGLDPSGWDPEPLASHYVEPREDLARSYRLL